MASNGLRRHFGGRQISMDAPVGQGLFLQQRNHVVSLLIHDAGLDCGSIARLTWDDAWNIKAPPSLMRALKALHVAECQQGFGGPRSHVIRLRGALSSDPVVRANGVLRLSRSHHSAARPLPSSRHHVATNRRSSR